jgi:hypothetical protein
MQPLLNLLGCHLKDDDVIEVLEHFDIRVVYEFDRTHENIDDEYWAAAAAAGFQLRFDQDQKLTTIFHYIQPAEGFSSFDSGSLGVPLYTKFADAEREFLASGRRYVQSKGESGSPWFQRWIKADHDAFTAHYEFDDDGMCRLVTIGAKNV